MALKAKDGKYKCFFCGEIFSKEEEADACTLSHNLIYVPMTREELNQLILFMYELRDPPIQLIGRLKKLQKKEARNQK